MHFKRPMSVALAAALIVAGASAAMAQGANCKPPGDPPANTVGPQPTSPPGSNLCPAEVRGEPYKCTNATWNAYNLAESARLSQRHAYVAKAQTWAYAAQAYVCCMRAPGLLQAGDIGGVQMTACPPSSGG
jgi:hypothetical protein